MAIIVCFGYSGYATVIVSPAAAGTNICSSVATGVNATGTITITEGLSNDFGSGFPSITFVPPAGWFFSGTPVIGTSGGDITSTLVSFSSSSITVTLTTSGTASLDFFTITNLRVSATSTGSPSGSILVSAVSMMTGITSGTTDLGNLSIAPAVTPAVSISATPSSTVCAGTTVSYFPTPTNGGASPSYQWFVNSVSRGISPSFSYIPVSGEVVTAVMTSTGACVTTATALSNSINMTVNPQPSPVTVSGSSNVCVGSSISLSSASTGGAWSSSNTSVATVNASGTVSGISAASANISYTITNSFGCTSTMAMPVTVNPLPVVAAISGASAICAGSTSSLSDVTASGVWSSSNAAIASVGAGNGVVTGGAAGAATINYMVTTLGCSTTVSKTVAVNPSPIVFAVTSPGGYCAGSLGTYVHVSNTESGTNYQLLNGGVPVSGALLAGSGGTGIDFSNQTAGIYTVQAIKLLNSCTSMMTGTATVVSNPLPISAGKNVTGGGSYCSGTTGSTIGLDHSDASIHYLLYFGTTVVDSVIGTITGSPISFAPMTAAGTYTVMGIDPVTRCGANMPGSATVTILPLPGSQVVTGDTSYCLGSVAGVHIGLAFSTIGINYQLYNSGGAVSSSLSGASSGLDFGTFPAGVYTVVATNTISGCMAGIGTHKVIANPTPTSMFNVTGGGSLCAGGTGVAIGLSWSDLGINYQLMNGSIPTGSVVAGTGSSPISFGLQTAGGTYAVMATNAITGCAATVVGPSSSNAIVTVTPAPAIYNISGTGGYCTGGAGIPVNLSWSDVGTTYQLYNGSTLMGSISGVGAPISFGNMFAAGSYSITASDGGMCTSTMAGSAVITVNPLPTVLPITGASNVCPGFTLSLSSATPSGVWSSNNTTIATVNTSGVVSGVATVGGGVVITYLVTSGAGCSASVTKAITVNVAPTIYSVTGGGTYCTGGTGVHVRLTSSDPGVDYSLYNGATLVSTLSGTTSSLDYGVIGASGTYSVKALNTSTGCTSSMGGTATVVVSPLPSAHSLTGGGGYCAGGAGVHIGIDGSNTIDNYTLYMGASAVTGAVTGTGIALDFGAFTTAGTYTVVAANSAGCTRNMTGSSTVTVNPLPTATPILGGGTICAGFTVALADSTSGGVWSSGNSSIATVSGAGIVTGVSVGLAPISYKVTNSFGCSSTVSTFVTIGLPMPTLTILPLGSATLCHGNPVNLTVTTSDPGLTFQWADAGGDILGAISSTYVATSIGSYSVTINNNGSCKHTYAPIDVINPPAPVIRFDSATRVLSTDIFASYQWLAGTSIIPGANTSLYTAPNAGGIFRVLVSDGNGCFDTSAAVLVPARNTTGTGTMNNSSVVSIYPNPASSILHIDAPVRVMVSVVSPDGRVMMDRQEAVSINVEHLSAGMYMIMVYDENSNLLKTEKFTKIQ